MPFGRAPRIADFAAPPFLQRRRVSFTLAHQRSVILAIGGSLRDGELAASVPRRSRALNFGDGPEFFLSESALTHQCRLARIFLHDTSRRSHVSIGSAPVA